jgi:regulator of protease activity HflC (stomatin/prohibitin superfamily)
MSTASALAPPRRNTVVDKELLARNGYIVIAIGLILIAVCAWLTYLGFDKDGHALAWVWLSLPAIIVIAIAVAKGLVILQPNESLVCLLFGSYVGTEHRPGLWWVNPFNSKNKISRRLETLEAGPLKVNDAVGNPIDIGAVVVWRVEDAAKALLEVGSYAN